MQPSSLSYNNSPSSSSNAQNESSNLSSSDTSTSVILMPGNSSSSNSVSNSSNATPRRHNHPPSLRQHPPSSTAPDVVIDSTLSSNPTLNSSQLSLTSISSSTSAAAPTIPLHQQLLLPTAPQDALYQNLPLSSKATAPSVGSPSSAAAIRNGGSVRSGSVKTRRVGGCYRDCLRMCLVNAVCGWRITRPPQASQVDNVDERIAFISGLV